MHFGQSESVSRGQPSGGFDLLVALQQRLIGPFRSEGRVLVDLIEPVEDVPGGICANGYCFLEVLNGFMHCSMNLVRSYSSSEIRAASVASD